MELYKPVTTLLRDAGLSDDDIFQCIDCFDKVVVAGKDKTIKKLELDKISLTSSLGKLTNSIDNLSVKPDFIVVDKSILNKAITDNDDTGAIKEDKLVKQMFEQDFDNDSFVKQILPMFTKTWQSYKIDSENLVKLIEDFKELYNKHLIYVSSLNEEKQKVLQLKIELEDSTGKKLIEETKKVKLRLADALESNELLERTVDILTSKVASDRVQLEEKYNEKLKDLSDVLTVKETSIQSFENTVDIAMSSLSTANSNLAGLRREISDRDSTILEQGEVVEDLKVEISFKDDEIKTLDEVIYNLDGVIVKLNDDIEVKNNKLKTKDEIIKGHLNTNANTEKTVNVLNDKIKKLEADFTHTNNSLIHESSLAMSDLEESNLEVEKQKGLINELKVEKVSFEAKIKTLNACNDSLKGTINRLRVKLDSKEDNAWSEIGASSNLTVVQKEKDNCSPRNMPKILRNMFTEASTNHSLIVKTFKINYDKQFIIGIDGIMSCPAKSESCIVTGCDKVLVCDYKNLKRSHCCIRATLDGTIREIGRICDPCKNSKDNIKLNPTKLSNEQ